MKKKKISKRYIALGVAGLSGFGSFAAGTIFKTSYIVPTIGIAFGLLIVVLMVTGVMAKIFPAK